MKQVLNINSDKVYYLPDKYIHSFLSANHLNDMVITGTVSVVHLDDMWSQKNIFDLVCGISKKISFNISTTIQDGVFRVKFLGTKMHMDIVVEETISGNLTNGKFITIIGWVTVYNGFTATIRKPLIVGDENQIKILKSIIDGNNKKHGGRSKVQAFWSYCNGKLRLFERRCYCSFGRNI